MAGIAGIAREKCIPEVEAALSRLTYRGQSGKTIRCQNGVTFGMVWPQAQDAFAPQSVTSAIVLDGELYNWPKLAEGAYPLEALENAYRVTGPAFLKLLDGPFALAIAGPDGFFLARDPLGIAPLYVGTHLGRLCFASEIKALAGWADDVMEFPPGHSFESGGQFVQYEGIESQPITKQSAEDVACELRDRLYTSVQKRVAAGEIGALLSGGLDSAAMTALAAREVTGVHTFAVGMADSSDLKYACEVAEFCGTRHHEKRVDMQEAIAILPEVIYHLESFDALLVRSSVMHFIVGKLAADVVPAVLSGEGGDELFAGYSYLKDLPLSELPIELIDITSRLHNTALQRVDRCSAAHNLVTRTGFLDKAVIRYALQIPVEMKIRRNGEAIEKWILRRAMDELLPEAVLQRPKEKFWQGSGIGEHFAAYAETTISDEDFRKERHIHDGAELATKEELLYYRIFREHFGDTISPSLVGRTKKAGGTPVQHPR